MAEFTAFVVYFNATAPLANPNHGVYVAAVADAAAGATYIADNDNIADATARYGAGALLASSAAMTIPRTPQIAAPGRAWVNQHPNPTALQFTPTVGFPLREGFRQLHTRLEYLSTLLREVGPHYPSIDVELAHDMLYNLHRGAYVTWNTPTSLMSNAQKVTWLQLSALGPEDEDGGGNPLYDRNDPETIFPILDTWRTGLANLDTARTRAGRPLSIPEVTLNAGNTAVLSVTRRDFGDILQDNYRTTVQAAADPTIAQLAGGNWIDSINA